MPNRQIQGGGYLVKDIVKAFEAGHVTELDIADRRYVVEWLRLTRPYMRQQDIARLLGVTERVVKEDCAFLQLRLKDTVDAIDVSLILAEYGLQVKRQIQDIEASKAELERLGKNLSKTYLDFCTAGPKLYSDWVYTMKTAGLIDDGNTAPQSEFRYKAVTHRDGSITSETIIKRTNQDLKEVITEHGYVDIEHESAQPGALIGAAEGSTEHHRSE